MLDIAWPTDYSDIAEIFVYFIALWVFYRVVIWWPLQKIREVIGI